MSYISVPEVFVNFSKMKDFSTIYMTGAYQIRRGKVIKKCLNMDVNKVRNLNTQFFCLGRLYL